MLYVLNWKGFSAKSKEFPTYDREDAHNNESRAMTILKPEPFAFARGEFEVIATFENELSDGRHGYSQEFAIRNTLMKHNSGIRGRPPIFLPLIAHPTCETGHLAAIPLFNNLIII